MAATPSEHEQDDHVNLGRQRRGPRRRHYKAPARLLSDCHAAAVEAREGKAVEGFTQRRALVTQHADSHFLAECHRGGRVGTPGRRLLSADTYRNDACLSHRQGWPGSALPPSRVQDPCGYTP